MMRTIKTIATSQPPSGGCVLKPFVEAILSTARTPAAFGRLCVETYNALFVGRPNFPAAFGRLCVETVEVQLAKRLVEHQPPSGGCVLKLYWLNCCFLWSLQPPSGGCVLKHAAPLHWFASSSQPPSGGCVLKLLHPKTSSLKKGPAAFGRLCVETIKRSKKKKV